MLNKGVQFNTQLVGILFVCFFLYDRNFWRLNSWNYNTFNNNILFREMKKNKNKKPLKVKIKSFAELKHIINIIQSDEIIEKNPDIIKI